MQLEIHGIRDIVRGGTRGREEEKEIVIIVFSECIIMQTEDNVKSRALSNNLTNLDLN